MNFRFTIYDLRAEAEPDASSVRQHGSNAAKTGLLVNRKSNIVNQRAFTMIEIAIAIGVLAFALVAIVGVLPTGLRSQQETHEETIVNQDGPYFLEMLRNGAHGLDHLTNYVEWIQITNAHGSVVFTNRNFPFSRPPGAAADRVGEIANGEIILQTLSTPKYIGSSSRPVTNLVRACVHSISGTAVQQGRASRDLGFTYLLTSELVPFSSDINSLSFFAPQTVTFSANDNSAANLERSNRWLQAQQLARTLYDPTNANFFDLRLTFRWPLRPDFTTGGRRETYRAAITSTMTNVPIPGVPLIYRKNNDGGDWQAGFYFLPQQMGAIPAL